MDQRARRGALSAGARRRYRRDLPRSTAGKTLKRVLREQYTNRAAGEHCRTTGDTVNMRIYRTACRLPSAAAPAANFLSVHGVHIHYLDAPGGSPPIVMLHGLSANAHCFSGLIAAGLSPTFRMIAPDLRGRGRTDKPATGYTMADHAADVLGLLDALGLDRVVLAGHSFGGYVAIYLASKFPERIEKLIVIDAAITLNPRVGELLKPTLDRLTRVSPSVDAYITEARSAPHLDGFWDGRASSNTSAPRFRRTPMARRSRRRARPRSGRRCTGCGASRGSSS